jgi:hypothetical protein
MATNDQLKALVKSHADRDDSQFYSVAMQVAAKAARSGQDKFASLGGPLLRNGLPRPSPKPDIAESRLSKGSTWDLAHGLRRRRYPRPVKDRWSLVVRPVESQEKSEGVTGCRQPVDFLVLSG